MQRRKFVQQSLLAGGSLLTFTESIGNTKQSMPFADATPFHCNYGIHDGMFKNLAGDDFIDQIKFENGDDSSVIGPVYVSKENLNIDVDEYYELFNKKETLEKIKAEYFSLPQKLILIT